MGNTNTQTTGTGNSAVQYQDGQVIRLPHNWKMEFLMNWDAEFPYLQGFVMAPDGKNSASLACARELGTTSCDDEIELPHVVHAYIMREEFDEYA
jgi:hypothetical protein